MALLAFIGLIAILIFLRKIMNAIGKSFDALSHDLSDRAVSNINTQRQISKETKRIREKINTIKGNGTDHEYWTNVQKEIDGLTK